MKTIRSQIMLLFGGSITVMLLVFGGILYQQITNTVVPLTKEISSQVAAMGANAVGQWLVGHIDQLDTVASDPRLKNGEWVGLKST